jgi:hypothetical protein
MRSQFKNTGLFLEFPFLPTRVPVMTSSPHASVLRVNTTSTSRVNLNLTSSLTCKQYPVYFMDPNFQEDNLPKYLLFSYWMLFFVTPDKL